MSTTSTGRQAEAVAAAYLIRQGYMILEHNWRTRWCEIDIVAQKDTSVSFVEVKYRRRDRWGHGMDYITPAKQKQMIFAAEFWASSHDWRHKYCLAAIEVSGPTFMVTEFLPEL